jgi:hypothetical protein
LSCSSFRLRMAMLDRSPPTTYTHAKAAKVTKK